MKQTILPKPLAGLLFGLGFKFGRDTEITEIVKSISDAGIKQIAKLRNSKVEGDSFEKNLKLIEVNNQIVDSYIAIRRDVREEVTRYESTLPSVVPMTFIVSVVK